jgi:hypothetical protein
LKSGDFLDSRTNSAQISQELITPKMRFPKIIRHRKAEVTSIPPAIALKPQWQALTYPANSLI